jgi:hypothetical protein
VGLWDPAHMGGNPLPRQPNSLGQPGGWEVRHPGAHSLPLDKSSPKI